MGYASEQLIETLRLTREALGLTQRALAQRTGLGQSHLSHIERGLYEPRISSLLEIARALDLELLLVPKKLLPAVQSILDSEKFDRQFSEAGPRSGDREISRAERATERLRQEQGGSADLDRISEYLRFLKRIRLSPKERQLLHSIIRPLQEPTLTPGMVQPLMRELQSLRNSIAHGVPQGQRPAYGGGEDDDA
jgi:transcriptional regulator with XRE-family HTH domain